MENVSNLFKLSISMEKLEIKMHFEKFYVKVVKSGFLVEKVAAMATALLLGSNQHSIVFYPINFMKTHQISLE